MVVVCLLISVAFLTVIERKAIGAIQRRKGPNSVGFFGILQAIADGLKLFVKEVVLPSSSNSFLFFLAPFITFFFELVAVG